MAERLVDRSLLLRDDAAIDTDLAEVARYREDPRRSGTEARNAVGAALSYIRRRKSRMRYATSLGREAAD